jgi:hypothetical protein
MTMLTKGSNSIVDSPATTYEGVILSFVSVQHLSNTKYEVSILGILLKQGGSANRTSYSVI